MYTSIAKGGPRDGIKLTASGSWDGMIRKPGVPRHMESINAYFPGKYQWDSSSGWTWYSGTFKRRWRARYDLARNWELVLK